MVFVKHRLFMSINTQRNSNQNGFGNNDLRCRHKGESTKITGIMLYKTKAVRAKSPQSLSYNSHAFH